jgi:tetratricopeptide (TPR) repeat protein
MGRTRALLSLSQNEVEVDKSQDAIRSLHKFDKNIKRISFLLVILLAAFTGYYALNQYTLSKQSFESKAIVVAKDKVRTQPRNADARVMLGLAFEKEGRYEEAIEQYKLAIKLMRDHQEALLYTGIAYMKLDQLDDALYYLDKEITYYKNTNLAKSNSMLEKAYYYGAVVLWEKKKYDKALDYVDKALEIMTTSSDSHLLKGRIFLDKKENDYAIAEFSKALEFDPKYVDALYGLALAYEKKGNRAEAVKRYENVLKVVPDYRLAEEGIARLRLK